MEQSIFGDACEKCKNHLSGDIAFALVGSFRYNGTGTSLARNVPEAFCSSGCALEYLNDHYPDRVITESLDQPIEDDMCEFCERLGVRAEYKSQFLLEAGAFTCSFCSLNCLRTALSVFYIRSAMSAMDAAADERHIAMIH